VSAAVTAGGEVWRRRARAAAGPAALVVLTIWVFSPFFADVHAMGFQDWDVQAAFRYVTSLSLQRHGELPFWNPWFCGGFPAWGYAEGAPNLVSPFAPLYLLFPLLTALRLEVVAASLVGLAGTYLVAGRFTRSAALRTFVAAIWMLNTRWTMQVASGHMWHLAYAWTPFAFYFMDRALRVTTAGDGRPRWSVAAAATLALIIYVGGIYPYPHTVMLLGVYVLVLAISVRSFRPVLVSAGIVVASLALAAPKLLPVMDTMSRFPRLIGSNEPITLLDLWSMMTARDQTFQGHPLLPIAFSWVWWEWGMYVGVPGVLALVAALVPWRGGAAPAMGFRLAGLGCFALAMGNTLWLALHTLPYFQSQHIPSRLMFPGALMLALALVTAVDGWWGRQTARRPALEPALLVVVFLYAVDLAVVARPAMDAPFHLTVPHVEKSATFLQDQYAPWPYGKPDFKERRLRERFDWPQQIIYPSMRANHGVVNCYGVPREVRSVVTGHEQPGYRGELYVHEGGRAETVQWAPNTLVARVSGAKAGSTLVFNMNYDAGWRARGGEAFNWRGLLGVKLGAGEGEVKVSYWPVGMTPGLIIFSVTVLAGVASAVRSRRRRRGTVAA
jgi:hypothetical protein